MEREIKRNICGMRVKQMFQELEVWVVVEEVEQGNLKILLKI